MKIVVGIFPTQKIADKIARLDAHLDGAELRMRPQTALIKNGKITYYMSVDQIPEKIMGLELSSYYTHYDVQLTHEQSVSLKQRTRG